MKKILAIILVSFTVFCMLGVTAFADMGPKPSTTVYIKGIESGRTYYATLLSKNSFEPPDWNTYEGDDPEYIAAQSPQWQAFYEFSLTDEYYFLQRDFKMSGDDSFEWGYRPPTGFKILLYFPDEGSLIASPQLEANNFYSEFKVTVENGDIVKIQEKKYDFFDALACSLDVTLIAVRIISFLTRMGITLIGEFIMALIFGYRSKWSFKIIILTNVLTQLVLNTAILIADRNGGYFAAVIAYITAEVLIFASEAAVYAKTLPKEKGGKKRAVLYALSANAASLLAGYVFYSLRGFQ